MFGAALQGDMLGFVIVILAFLNTAQCFNFTSNFEGLSIAYRGTGNPDIGKAEHCAIFKNRRKCLFNAKNLRLDKNSLLQLTVSAEGRTIKCNKKLGIGINQWYGSCDGNADDANFVTRLDKNGIPRVYGSIRVGNEICHIGPNIDGDDEILCIPKSDFPAEDDPSLSTQEKSPENLRLLASTGDMHFGFVPIIDTKESPASRHGSNHRDNDRQLFDDSGANIDVLVVWTKLAECSKAGLAQGCTVTKTTENMMRGLIDLTIAETNTAYAMSGIFTSLRLVHAYRDPDYVEADDFQKSLDHVTTPNDGFLDSVHSKRALYGADAVHMIVGASSSCGRAWKGNRSEPTVDFMFAVTRYTCATGQYSFGHELGHNLGMFHDRGTEKTCNESSTFNYGYRHPNAEFRTILSLDCKMAECDNMPKNGCTRIQRFSNSDSAYTYNGKPIGDAKQDNAKQANSVRARVAAFFPAMNCRSDIECNDRDSTTTDTCNTANRVCVFTPGSPPSRAPVNIPSPTKVPISAPINVPTPVIAPPTQPNVLPPTKFPNKSPTKAPVSTIAQPVKPSAAPVASVPPPMKVPISAPINVPTPAIAPPTQPNVLPPTKFPNKAPTKAPVSTIAQPVKPSAAPVATSKPTEPTLISPAKTASPTSQVTTSSAPIGTSERKGFFSMIFQLIGRLLSLLLGRMWSI